MVGVNGREIKTYPALLLGHHGALPVLEDMALLGRAILADLVLDGLALLAALVLNKEELMLI